MFLSAYWALAAVVGILLSTRLRTLVERARSPLGAVPGPWYSRWTSVGSQYYWFTGKKAIYVDALHKHYGICLSLLSHSEVDFASVSAAKQIHSFRTPFPKTQYYANLSIGMGAANVFTTTNLAYHGFLRRLLFPPMSESTLKTYEPIVDGRVRLAVQRMAEEMKKRGAADVFKWWLFLATDTIGELAFGDSFRMLEQGRENQYSKDMKMIARLSGLRAEHPTLFKLASYLPLPVFRASVMQVQRIRTYAEQSLERYRLAVAAEPNNPKPTVFTKLFNAGDEGLSMAEITSQAQAYIIAGSDTTANTLTFLVWAVCKDEKIKQRLTAELAGLPEDYTDEGLKSLPYLTCVIKEALRIYAAAPSALPREVTGLGCEIDGYWLPGRVTASTQAYSMHRNPIAFPDPEKYDPSRWEAPNKDMNDLWMAFGAGTHTCIGIHLAQMELRKSAAAFFRAFPNARVSLREGFCDDDMEQVIYLLMFPKKKRCLIELS
ncbi:cytochrome protein [Polyplosphaeria fusca]|uniref:Cytochrome protein n=1 Tax=Polyplosphaeria fusca TaxID=682080 RepID=A0A9P4QVX0_9PLEO|nr:cytochrome protein [Polyplosphaeria fusca]